MKKTTLDFINTNAGRAICAIALLITLWLLRTDLHSQASAKWISDGHGTFGQVFDLGLMFGALFGIGIWLCLPVRNGESNAPVVARGQSVAKSTRHLKDAICVMRGYGFRIVREGRPNDDLLEDSLNTACLLLGMPAADDNKKLAPVVELAQTLRDNI